MEECLPREVVRVILYELHLRKCTQLATGIGSPWRVRDRLRRHVHRQTRLAQWIWTPMDRLKHRDALFRACIQYVGTHLLNSMGTWGSENRRWLSYIAKAKWRGLYDNGNDAAFQRFLDDFILSCREFLPQVPLFVLSADYQTCTRYGPGSGQKIDNIMISGTLDFQSQVGHWHPLPSLTILLGVMFPWARYRALQLKWINSFPEGRGQEVMYRSVSD